MKRGSGQRERQPALCLGSFVTKRQKTGSAREETEGRTSLLPTFKAYPVRFELSEGGGQRGHARGDEGKDGLTQLLFLFLYLSVLLLQLTDPAADSLRSIQKENLGCLVLTRRAVSGDASLAVLG